MAALVTKTRELHGRMAAELLAAIVVDRATRIASQTSTPRRALEIGIYVASVEAGLGIKRVCRSTGIRRQRLRHVLSRLEDRREHPAFDKLIRVSAMEALA